MRAVRGRVVVTGGAGFIGRSLTARLLAEGDEVIVVDDFSSGPRRNLDGLGFGGRLQVVEHDVTASWPSSLDRDVDRIFHLACPASPVAYQRDPVRTTRTAVLGSLTALEVARRTGARVLLSSTSEVYGDPLVHPQSEGYWGNVNPVGPRACYDEGKRCAETFFDRSPASVRHRRPDRAHLQHLRPAHATRRRPGRVDLRLQALHGRPLTVFGRGDQTRSFCFVDDLVEGLIRLMDVPSAPDPVNLGNPEEVSVADLAARVVREVGTGEIVHRPLPVDDPTCRRPDIRRARELLGWAPTVALTDGLRRTVAHFRALQRHAGPTEAAAGPDRLTGARSAPGGGTRDAHGSGLPAARTSGEQLETRGQSLTVGAAEVADR